MTIKRALLWTLFWIGIALLFNAGVYWFMGSEKALQFLGGYIIEKSLSIDNLFLFLMIFSSFGIPVHYQRRVLNYGIIGAIILRLLFILLGAAVVNRFHWVLYVFGVLLVVSGIKMFSRKEEKNDYGDSFALRALARIIPVSPALEGDRFFVRKDRVLYATPLLAVLAVVEASDIVFAIDSIPAIFSITTDTFIVFTSNVLAILGLRSMYFVLEKLHQLFRFVQYGVALILTLTGVKLLILMFHIEVPIVLSVTVIFAILAVSILASLFCREKLPVSKESP
ncbi:tellurite resistance protein TerC [Hydrogenispora ethanolica]|uniref:Tellurite resistance protein TerC n=1 Tax=Hydrogenispora ethanolica TaxID=1082276 RepID=A0A4V2QD37_HYDET|nr:TerC/Alx family metal homeostasis membrane protein [Hydrogenispora ethanolica]TCL62177.1 tellurite resistance protein TerC [Hydrogenispora ethanolica]